MIWHNAVGIKLIFLVISVVKALLNNLSNRFISQPRWSEIVCVQSFFKSSKPITMKF